MKKRLLPLACLALTTLALLFFMPWRSASVFVIQGGEALGDVTFETAFDSDSGREYYVWRDGKTLPVSRGWSDEMRALLASHTGALLGHGRYPLGELAILRPLKSDDWSIYLFGAETRSYELTQPGRLVGYGLDENALYLHFLTPEDRISIQRLQWSNGHILEQWVDLADLNLTGEDVQQLWYDESRGLLLIAHTRQDLPLIGYDFACGCVSTLPVEHKPFQVFGLEDGYLFVAPRPDGLQIYRCDRAMQVIGEDSIILGPVQENAFPYQPFALDQGKLYGMARWANGFTYFFVYDVVAEELTDKARLRMGDFYTGFQLSPAGQPSLPYPTLQ